MSAHVNNDMCVQTIGVVSIRSADETLCLGFDANTSAYGGHGNSVVARSCKQSAVTNWRWSGAVGGSLLQLAHTHELCSGSPGGEPCSCVHPVVCTACHGTEVYTPPTSVELIRCQNGSHMLWSDCLCVLLCLAIHRTPTLRLNVEVL
jgi:hypothetical protein